MTSSRSMVTMPSLAPLGFFTYFGDVYETLTFAARSHFRMKARDVGGELDVVV